MLVMIKQKYIPAQLSTVLYLSQANIVNIGNWTNFVSFSLGFVSQVTKHQSVQPILFYSFPIMFTLLLSAK